MDELRSQNPACIYEDNTIKVAMYRLRYHDGSGARSDSAFAEEINNLNTFFSSHDICFSLMRIENIDHADLMAYPPKRYADNFSVLPENEHQWITKQGDWLCSDIYRKARLISLMI